MSRVQRWVRSIQAPAPRREPEDGRPDQHGVRTDLALEAHEVLVRHEGPPEIPGVTVENERMEHALISRVSITTEDGARAMGKVMGNYSTIESEALRQRNQQVLEKLSQTVAGEIQRFLQAMGISEDGPVLVVGLGNWNATPDALGPRVVHQLLVTRHLYELSPPELRGGLRPVAAISPGVMGITGMETGEIIHALVNQIRPALVIAVDALAARSTERVCTTIQIADVGIHPGSGVGNRRAGITRQTLGCPVLAIGVPTVVHALTIVHDAIDRLSQGMAGPQADLQAGPQGLPQAGPLDAPQPMPQVAPQPAGPEVPAPPGGGPVLDPGLIRWGRSGGPPQTARIEAAGAPGASRGWPAAYGGVDVMGFPVDAQAKRALVQDLLHPYMGELIVTPKDIDTLVEDVAETVAGALNAALHPSLDLTDVLNYLAGA